MTKMLKWLTPIRALSITVVIVVVLLFAAYLDYHQRKMDYYQLMENQAYIFLEALDRATLTLLDATIFIEKKLNQLVLNELQYTDLLLESRRQPEPLIPAKTLCDEYVIYNRSGKKIYSAFNNTQNFQNIPEDIIQSFLYKNQKDTVFSYYPETDNTKEILIAIHHRLQGGLIIGIVNPDDVQQLRRKLGFGYFLKQFQLGKNVEYIVVQNSQAIIAGSFGSYKLSTYNDDPSLEKVEKEGGSFSRIITYKNGLVFETVQAFRQQDKTLGVFRLGLSMEELENLQKTARQRWIVVTLFLFGVGLLLSGFTYVYRRRELLDRQYQQLYQYTNYLLDHLQTGVLSVEYKEKITLANKKACEILGNNKNLAIPFSVNELPEQVKLFIQECHDRDLDFREKEIRLQEQSEEQILYIRAQRLYRENNPLLIVLLDDVTDRTRLEEQVLRNQRLMAMKNMAQAVAHEVKNPLNAMQLILDLLRKKGSTDISHQEYEHYLDTLRQEIARISHLIKEYLSLNRPIHPHREEFSVSQLVDDAVNLFLPTFKQHDIQIQLNIQPSLKLYADRELIKEVLVNLIKNAVEAMEEGGLLSIECTTVENKAIVRIQDTGIGISSEHLSSIFDLYFSTKKNGNGIGLYRVQQIVEAHQGEIFVHSEEGKGTTFTIVFPDMIITKQESS